MYHFTVSSAVWNCWICANWVLNIIIIIPRQWLGNVLMERRRYIQNEQDCDGNVSEFSQPVWSASCVPPVPWTGSSYHARYTLTVTHTDTHTLTHTHSHTHTCPHRLTFTWLGCCGLGQRHKPAKLAHSFFICSCAYFCLYDPFNCISFQKFSRQLFTFSLCSSGLISAFLVLSTLYLFIKVSFSPDVSLFGWLGN